MTKQEAFTIAFFRIHFSSSFAKVGQIASAIWGLDGARELSGRPKESGLQIIGQGLVIQMEDALGLDRCESDDMEMKEGYCGKCRHVQFYLSHPSKDPTECGECGEMGVNTH